MDSRNKNRQTGRPFSRREFLSVAGVGVTSPLAIMGTGVAPPSRIIVGMIGTGSQGMVRLREFMGHPDVRVAAVCDVDENHLERGASEVEKTQGRRPATFSDFRRLLENRDVDAVVVVTPDHWHAIPVIQACRAGKDVFVEKPLSYSVREGRAMVEAALSNGCVTQMGNHIHNDLSNYRRVVELVQSDYLGEIRGVTCWKTSPVKGRGHPSDCPPPRGLDYDFWLGPAPSRPYNPLRSHRSFRYFWDYSGGVFIDFWCHIADVVYWALDLKAPRNISAVGGRFLLDDATETPDTLDVSLEFPEVHLRFGLKRDPPPPYRHLGDIGCVFEGTEAALVTNYGKHEVYVKGEKVNDFPRPARSIPDSPGHIREFLDAVKTRNVRTTCNIAYGDRLSKAGLLANIAFRSRSSIRWEEETETIIGNGEAQRLLGRSYRSPWSL